MIAHMTSAELGDELGRSDRWICGNWRMLVEQHGLPPPLLRTGDVGQPLKWNRAQIYAWLDRQLTPPMRAATAAHRAAMAAARQATAAEIEAGRVVAARERLDQRFAGKGDAA